MTNEEMLAELENRERALKDKVSEAREALKIALSEYSRSLGPSVNSYLSSVDSDARWDAIAEHRAKFKKAQAALQTWREENLSIVRL